LNSSGTNSVFVIQNNDVYFDYTWNSTTGAGVQKLTSNLSNSIAVLTMCSICYDLFLDIHNNIYCSMDGNHQVVKKSFDNGSESIQIVAGTGVNGSTAYMLNSPKGIFVDIDTNLDLYVADHSNNRIQFFPFGQLGGITIAGNGVPIATNILNRPMSIALDRNKYLFIVDYGNHRIVVSEPYGFRCIVGCSNSTGTALYQLNYPRSIGFDSFGNIFVVDDGNSRIQKFTLITSSNSCSKFIKKHNHSNIIFKYLF